MKSFEKPMKKFEVRIERLESRFCWHGIEIVLINMELANISFPVIGLAEGKAA